MTHDSLPNIMTDETQLVQVFQNLIGNAIKYRSAEAPRVHLSATKNGEQTNGSFPCAITAWESPLNILNGFSFFSSGCTDANEFEGTGIGLAICKKVLERMGGRIWVDSQPGIGSTFYFALPKEDKEL